ncbi:MAG: BA14K family protein [Bauldia sp.]
MKKILALGLAAAMAAGTIAATSTEASARPHYWPQHNFNHGHYWGGGGGPSFFFGFGAPNYYYPDYYYAPPLPVYNYGSAHIRWCAQTYKTYNARTDTFFVRPGVPARCVAPFDYNGGY